MKTQVLRCAVLVAALGLAGCGSRGVIVSGQESEDTATRLGEQIGLSISDWLNRPRAELAKAAEELTATIHLQQERARTNPQAVELLPKLHADATVPVLNEAKFSETAGFSLPPYLKEGTRDAALALHLARHGDVEAALKLADPQDGELLKKIESYRLNRNYPVEWTRLVGLAQLAAQFKLASGETEGATELVVLHKQLKLVLDSRAASGSLGAALLPRGRRALGLAVAAWKADHKTALVGDVEAALGSWGNGPEGSFGLAPGAARADVARVFTEKDAFAGRLALTRTGPATRRVLDVLALPTTFEGVESVAAILNGTSNTAQLTELVIVYRPRIHDNYPEPGDLVQRLTEAGVAPREKQQSTGLVQQTFGGGGQTWNAAVAAQSSACGGFVRFTGAREASAAALPRHFGAVQLDASFEQNRVQWVPGQKSGSAVETANARSLGRLQLPVALPKFDAAVLRREEGRDVVAGLVFRWAVDQNPTGFTRLALPLWAAFGAPRIEGVADSEGGQLAFTWEDGKTQLNLRLPFGESRAPELVASNGGSGASAESRAKSAEQFDQAQRKARLESGKALVHLPRWLYEDRVQLGQTRAQALAALPRSQSIRQSKVPGGVSLLFFAEPAPTATYAPRQLFVRFDDKDRVAEIRLRYQHGPSPARPGTSLLDVLTKQNGAPAEGPSDWVRLWSDLPAQKPMPTRYSWVDDRTIFTCQRDAGGYELAVRDNPLNPSQAKELPLLTFLSRGPENCTLGQDRAAVLRAWKAEAAEPTADGAIPLVPARTSPYDLVLVWFEGGKVTRVVARHRAAVTPRGNDYSAALQEAWSRDIDHLGWLRRQEIAEGGAVQAYAWNDDRNRIRTFVQDSEQGPRLLTEWREW
jgi:hypothetical protein